MWEEPRLLLAARNNVLKLVPDAVGLRTYELVVDTDDNVTAMAVDVPAKTLYYATASPGGVVHGLSVASGSIFAVSILNPGTTCVFLLPYFWARRAHTVRRCGRSSHIPHGKDHF